MSARPVAERSGARPRRRRKRVTHATDLETTGLFSFAAAVAFAALVLIGQAIARVVYAEAGSFPALRSLGFTRRIRSARSSRRSSSPFRSTTVGAIVGAVAFSIVVPGRAWPAASIPSLGVHADWHVFSSRRGRRAPAFVVAARCSPPCARRRADRRRTVAVRARSGAAQSCSAPAAHRARRRPRARRRARRTLLPVRPAITRDHRGHRRHRGRARPRPRHRRRAGPAGTLRPECTTRLVTPDSAADFHALPAASSAQLPPGRQRSRTSATEPPTSRAPACRSGTSSRCEATCSYTLLSGQRTRRRRDGHRDRRPNTRCTSASATTVRLTDAHPMTLRISGIALLPGEPALVVRPRTLGLARDDARDSSARPEKAATDEVFAVTGDPASPRPTWSRHSTNTSPTTSTPSRSRRTSCSSATCGRCRSRSRPSSSCWRSPRSGTRWRQRCGAGATISRCCARWVSGPRQSALCIAALAATVAVIGLAVGLPLGAALGQVVWHWVATRTPLLYVAPLATVAAGDLHPGHVRHRQRARGHPGLSRGLASPPPPSCAPNSRLANRDYAPAAASARGPFRPRRATRTPRRCRPSPRTG